MPTKISWTDETWNFLGGCTSVSEGCLHCAAAASAQLCVNRGNKKYEGLVKNGKWTGEVRLFPDELDKPLHWRNPRMIFPAFMGDLFHESVPFEFIDKVFVNMFAASRHTYQILTKRPKRVLEYVNRYRSVKFYNHKGIWLGVTAENQRCADERIPILLQIPAAVWFVSFEPLLGEIEIREDLYRGRWYPNDTLPPRPNWVIIGCESINGRAGRLLLPEIINHPLSGVKVSAENIWRGAAKDIVEQCKAANVPVFVKQIPLNGKVSKKMAEWPEWARLQEYPK